MSGKPRSHGSVLDVPSITMSVVVWGAILLFALGVLLTALETVLGAAEGDSGDGGADAKVVTVAATSQTVSEVQAELYAQALDSAGYEVERSYGHEGWRAMRDAFVASDGSFVVPVQAEGAAPEDIPVSGGTMLQPTAESVGGRHPVPLAGEDWAASHPGAVAALEETTERLDPEEFARMAAAVDSGESVVVAEVYRWRAESGLPAAPDVRPPEGPTGEGERA